MNQISTRVLICLAVLAGTIAVPVAAAAGDDDTRLQRELISRVGADAAFDTHPATGALRYAGGTTDAPLAAADPRLDSRRSADRFIDRYGTLFGVDSRTDDLAEPRRHAGGSQVEALRYDQRHHGLPVIGGQLAVQVADDGAVLSTTATISPDLDVDTTPVLDAAEAVAAAVAVTAKYDRTDPAALAADEPTLAIFDSALLGVPGERRVALVWQVEVRTDAGDVDRIVLVDAHRGAVSLTYSNVHHALNRVICNANHTTAQVPCTAPVRVEGQGASGNTDVNDAYVNAGTVYSYYRNRFGRDSVDGKGLPLKSTVNYCPQGPCSGYPNAYWDGNLAQMVYGHGFARGDDVVGHEMTHAVTQYESGLVYYAQPGAINESLSDIFGELLDLANAASGGSDTPSVRWLIGEDIPGGAIPACRTRPCSTSPTRC